MCHHSVGYLIEPPPPLHRPCFRAWAIDGLELLLDFNCTAEEENMVDSQALRTT
jgi:hypothetical protein